MPCHRRPGPGKPFGQLAVICAHRLPHGAAQSPRPVATLVAQYQLNITFKCLPTSPAPPPPRALLSTMATTVTGQESAASGTAVICKDNHPSPSPLTNSPGVHTPTGRGRALCFPRHSRHLGRLLRGKYFLRFSSYFRLLLLCCSCFFLKKRMSGDLLPCSPNSISSIPNVAVVRKGFSSRWVLPLERAQPLLRFLWSE